MLLDEIKGATLAKVWVAEGLDRVSHRVSQAQKEAVVGAIFTIHGPPHTEAKTVASQHKWDVIKGVTVAFTQFVCPNDQSMVKH